MIPSQNTSSVPEGFGSVAFHVVIDDFNRVFCMEGPDSNGVRLHYEMQKRARAGDAKYRSFDFRTPSKKDAIDQINSYCPGYEYLGECLTVWASN